MEVMLATGITGTMNLAKKIFTTEKIRWAVNSFRPYTSPGGDGIAPITIKKSLNRIEQHLFTNFWGVLGTGKVFEGMEQRVVFIAKASRTNELPKFDRPISLL